jgi:NADP-dependent 3-hydroxy acid dehydrogenase YdfG
MKNVIITGSSRGIGFELVKLFNENDYKVIALSRNTKPISNLKLKNVYSHYLDISSSASINKTIKLIFKEFKKNRYIN